MTTPSMVYQDYRSSHTSSSTAASYQEVFSRHLPGAYWRTVEQPLLESLLTQVMSGRSISELNHLDVASGSGRLLEFFHGRTKCSTGLDISEEMLKHAKRLVPQANFLIADASHMQLSERFDMVTAFRFFLNAEPTLRSAVLDRIREHLQPGGLLIANIHSQPWSSLGMWRDFKRRLGVQADRNMKIGEFNALLNRHGFEVIAHRTYGYLPLYRGLRCGAGTRLFCALDQQLNRLYAKPNPFACCWMVAARVADDSL